MLRMQAGLGLILAAGLFTCVGVAGCSADGSGDEGFVPDIASEAGPTIPSSSGLGGSSSTSTSSSTGGMPDHHDSGMPPHDAGRDATTPRDSGSNPPRDAAPDARDSGGTTSPVAGTACTVMGDVKERACGFCGTQQTVCDTDGMGGSVWSDYGRCDNEVADTDDRCMPGTASDNDCGLCGKSADVCQRDCTWGRGSCREPAGACTPDEVRYITAGCGTSGNYRKQVCSATCSFGAASPMPCGGMDPFVNITRAKDFSVTINGVLQGEINKLNTSGTNPCQPANLLSDGAVPAANLMPYAYIELRNPQPKRATVELEFAPDASTASFGYTFAAVYDGSMPTDNASRAACTKSNEYCSSSSGSTYWSCFKGTDAFTIPANGKVFVYIQALSKLPAPVKFVATVTTKSFER